MFKEDLSPVPEDAGGSPGAAQPAPPAGAPASARWRPLAARLAGPVLRHRLFTVALLAAAVPRVMAMLGFRPAILFGMDSYDYLWGAVHLSPDRVNPSGYSLFLWVLRPFHSLALVVALQHLLGLAMAAMVYAVLRRFGLPAWGAVLAAAPVLYDPAQLVAETLIMADLLAMVLMMAGLAVLLWQDQPPPWAAVTAGLLIGASVIVRPTTLPLIIAVPLFLVGRRAGWRRAGAALAGGVLPVAAYMGWFAAEHGSFSLSQSNGLFLWSRTMSFADCAIIRPPAGLRPLCPTAQAGGLAEPVASRRQPPKRYLWNRQGWAWGQPARGIVPDKVPFTAANNARALRFAVTAIGAQPGAYAATVGNEFLQPFTTNDQTLRFPKHQTRAGAIDQADLRYALASVTAYTGSSQGLAPYVSFHFATRLHQPWAYLLTYRYQRTIFLPGPGLALIFLAGLAGILLARRRTAAAVLLWLSAIVIILVPIAVHEYTYRYAIPAVPLVCIAAALAFRRPEPGPAAVRQVLKPAVAA
jgi:hypothetical protein